MGCGVGGKVARGGEGVDLEGSVLFTPCPNKCVLCILEIKLVIISQGTCGAGPHTTLTHTVGGGHCQLATVSYGRVVS